MNQDNTSFLAALNFAVKRRPRKVPLIKRLITALNNRGTFCLPEANEYCTLDFKISQNKILNSLLEEKKTRANTIAFSNELFSLMSNETLIIPNITQVFFGSEGLIQDQKTECPQRMDFFKETSVIPPICYSCFKVQILLPDVVSLLQLMLIFRAYNVRAKCMVELREYVKFPYKGYIYCDSKEMAQQELAKLQNILEANGVSAISRVSHGCSEFGHEYPEFKYSASGEHEKFHQKNNEVIWHDWVKDLPEFKSSPLKHRSLNFFSLNDAVVASSWATYADIIGDEKTRQLGPLPAFHRPVSFQLDAREQATRRASELAELQSEIDAQNP